MWLGFLYSVPRVGSLPCLPGISLALCFPGFSLSREIPPILSHLATGHLSLYYCSHSDTSSHSKSKSSATPGPQFQVFSASGLPCYNFFCDGMPSPSRWHLWLCESKKYFLYLSCLRYFYQSKVTQKYSMCITQRESMLLPCLLSSPDRNPNKEGAVRAYGHST